MPRGGGRNSACFQSRPQDSLRKTTVLASECPLMSALGLSVHQDCLWRRKKSRELKACWEKLPCREMRREFRRWGQVGPEQKAEDETERCSDRLERGAEGGLWRFYWPERRSHCLESLLGSRRTSESRNDARVPPTADSEQ